MKKTISIIALCIGLLSCLVVAYFTVFLPVKQPASDIVIKPTPAMVERGRYLANNVVVCVDCHSDRDWTIYGGPAMEPLAAGREECITSDSGKSGIRVSEWTFPGRLCIRNITPDPETGIGNWTDGEIIRAFREGIGKDGRPLFPIMPYFVLRNISDDDSQAIVSYLRTLPPVKSDKPLPIVGFPMNWFMNLFPKPVAGPVPSIDPNDGIANGEYLATIARCAFCHTERSGQTRQPVMAKLFSGNVPFNLNGGETLYSVNLTPHPEGIGKWSKQDFIYRMKIHGQTARKVDPSQNTVSSWDAYAGMSDKDLGDIYDYLFTIKPKPTGGS